MKTDIDGRASQIIEDAVTRHVEEAWVLGCLEALHEEGDTDDVVRGYIPRSGGGWNHSAIQLEHGAQMTRKMLLILEDCRAKGLLTPIPHGADRDIREVRAWNAFLTGGREAVENHDFHSLFDNPLPRAIEKSLWLGAYNRLKEMRVARGLKEYAAYRPDEKIGGLADMAVMRADLADLAKASVKHAKMAGQNADDFRMDGITCPKTDQRLCFEPGRLLAPRLGKMVFPEGEPFRFEPVGAFEAPKPLRQIDITLPSGILLMADWFRIPGFNEGVAEREFDRPSINSDEGVDLRTRDHYERLGLMRIHTTNCAPAIIRDGAALRVGHLDEDHEDLWVDDPSAEYGQRRSDKWPEQAGRVCCDLWDVTFADREVIIDILVAGGEAISANGGIGDREREVTGYARSRNEASSMLDAYVSENDNVTCLEFAPGTVIQVTMATGHGAERFSEHFSSPDLSDWPFMEELFVLSPEPLAIGADLEDDLERPDWTWPERYAQPVMAGPDP